jgi:hypothetical protein
VKLRPHSELIRQRLSVVAQTAADSFQPLVNLGLPISMVRNAREVLERAHQTDARITAIHAVDPAGTTVHTTDPGDPGNAPDKVKLAQSLADGVQWSVESATDLFSGISILNAARTTVANVVVVYPKEEFDTHTTAVNNKIATITLSLLLIFSAAAFLLLRLRLAGAIRALSRLGVLMSMIRQGRESSAHVPPMAEMEAAKLGFLRADFETLENNLRLATENYETASSSLGATNEIPADRRPVDRDDHDVSPVVMTSTPGTSLAR